MKGQSAPPPPAGNSMNWITIVITMILVLPSVYLAYQGNQALWIVASLVVSIIVMSSVRIASEWDRVVVLRLGHYHKTVGPGMFFIIPAVDTIGAWIDTRTDSIRFEAESTMTADAVPVTVDAVMFITVLDARKAALEVRNWYGSMQLAAQTALRDALGVADLHTVLTDRTAMAQGLQSVLAPKGAEWGVDVKDVELRDVKLPDGLQDAMSREAQAEREKRARVKLAEAERDSSEVFVSAAKAYEGNPIAFELRQMNMTYEMGKQGSIILLPSPLAQSLDSSTSLALATAITRSANQKDH